MTVDYIYDEGVAFLTVDGDLDIGSVAQLREMAEMACTETTGTLRVNMAGVNFIDSSGISALVVLKNDAEQAHRVLILEEPSERVRRVLELTGLTEYFQIK
jgi:anti-sigma B factor antagonist